MPLFSTIPCHWRWLSIVSDFWSTDTSSSLTYPCRTCMDTPGTRVRYGEKHIPKKIQNNFSIRLRLAMVIWILVDKGKLTGVFFVQQRAPFAKLQKVTTNFSISVVLKGCSTEKNWMSFGWKLKKAIVLYPSNNIAFSYKLIFSNFNFFLGQCTKIVSR